MATFDISIAFDKSEYLNTQIKLFADTIKNQIPRDCILHVVTNREKTDESLIYLLEQIPNHKLYILEAPDLISRCKYLINALKVDCDKQYLMKMDLDVIPFKNINRLFDKITDEDIVIQMENRRVIPDDIIEARIWRQIYKAMGLKVPDLKISYIERTEIGKPLFNTGVFIIRVSKIKELRENWVRLTKICEGWIDFNVHPNEFAMTAMIFNYHLKYKLFSGKEIFNPIGHFRSGDFPSTELKEECQIPEEVILLHWHKPRWLKHLMDRNKSIQKLFNSITYLNDSFWKQSEEVYKETYGL
jgi:hypothetical protein